MLDRAAMSRWGLLSRLTGSARRHRAVVANGAVGPAELYVDLVAAATIAKRRHGPAVVLAECTWKLSSSRLDRVLCRAGATLLDGRRVTYCVLSTAEQRLFPDTWGVSPERVVFTPYCHTLTEEELAAPVSEGGGVFAGGNSLRDYGPLVQAARGLAATVTIATRLSVDAPLPANVALGPLSHEEFVARLRAADAVVVPLRPGLVRSAGQQTYLNAMALGKLVVVTDAPGVRDYVEHGATGLVVPPADADALADALRFALDPAHDEERRRIRNAARAVARTRFGPDAYVRSLLNVVSSAAGLPQGAAC